MCQGDKNTGTISTNTMFVMTPEAVKNMPPAQFAMYANKVIDYEAPKEDPHQIQTTAGDNLINYPGELTT